MPHGVCVLASITLPDANITELNLSGCNMDASSLGTLLGAMLQKQTVTSLDVSGQPLKAAGMQELTKCLRLNRKLQVLRARNISTPSDSRSEMLEFSKAVDTNMSLSELDLRGNRVHHIIKERLRRTMEEKRSIVPLPLDLKHTFLLCNRRLPHHMQLPEVMCVEVSSLFSDGAGSPLVLIFQYCALSRKLLLDEDTEDALHEPMVPPRQQLGRWADGEEDSDSEMGSMISDSDDEWG